MTSHREPHLAKDSLLVLSARLGAQAGLALFTLLIARRLGSAGFGEYAFIASAVFIGNMLTTCGTDMLLIREIATRRDFSQLIPSLFLQLLLSMTLILLVWLLPPLRGQSIEGWLALKIYSLALVPFAFFTVFSSVLRGLQRMDRYASLNLSVSLIQLAATFFFIRAGSSVVALAWLLLAVQVAAAALAGWYCRDQFTNFYLPVQFSLRQFQPVLPLAALGILGILYQRLGLLLVTFLLGAAATGWVAAALRVVEFAKTAHLAVFTALYPAMARSQAVPGDELKTTGLLPPWHPGPPRSGAGKGSETRREKKFVSGCLRALVVSPRTISKDFRAVWLVLLAGALTAALGLSLLASTLILVLFGADYSQSIPALRLLAWMLPPFTINTYLTLALVAANRERPVLIALAAGLATLVALNFLWIPRFGILGASWAILIAESLQVGVLIVQYSKNSSVRTTSPAPTAGTDVVVRNE